MTQPTRWEPGRAREQLVDALDELALIWPALDAALERDHAPAAGEKVTSSGNVLSAPVNTDVLRALAEIPGPAQLRVLPAAFDRYLATNAPELAQRLGQDVEHWHRLAKRAVGLLVVDRPLGQYCPRHDDPLVELVAPGDEGWLRAGRRGDLSVQWRHVDAVLCRHCQASWAPGQYPLLGRMLRQADRRRVEAPPR